MNYKTNKIIILGGGSAGWMTAATLIKHFPEKEIILIESPNIPTIGVGESTLGGINNWLASLDIKDEDFMKACDATYKYAIKFKDFSDINREPFYYPFGKMFLEGTSNLGAMDWHLKKAIYPETSVQDYARCFMPVMALVEKNRINLNETGVFDNFRFDRDTAYHFDAIKFANWLKTSYAIPRGVINILSEIKEIKTNDNLGIEFLKTETGEIFSADLYIDCTGFKSILLGEALQEPFIHFDHVLPNNRAWACPLPYIDKEKEMDTFTNCTALGNGWVWNTPTFTRIGTGYVYCDRYISPEDALEEFKKYLLSEKMSIPRTKEEIEKLNFREIKFKSGIRKRTWVKNVCAIGLSAGFLEPLESTGLYTVHEFLLKLVKTLGNEKISQWDKDVYNTATKNQFENFSDFVAIHYALSKRTDTKYWQDIFNKTFDQDMLDLKSSRKFGYYELANQYMFDWSFSTDYPAGTHFIATGMNFNPIDKSRLNMIDWLHQRNYPELVEKSDKVWKENKKRWNAVADSSPSHYHYLKNTIYKDVE
jgi:flavin-dependent dehydrogenase